MTKRYEKFEEWMIGERVNWEGNSECVADSGLVVAEYGGVSNALDIRWDSNGSEQWIGVSEVTFEKDNKVEEQDTEQEIKWEVGQVVWCLFAGKGRVVSVDEGNFDPVQVEFDDGGYMTYRYSGMKSGYDFRCLFFSEPKIEAELFPPKKPFVPTLKRGDRVHIYTKGGLFPEGFVREVFSEVDDRIYISENHHYFLKKDILSIRVLGEEIKFEEN